MKTKAICTAAVATALIFAVTRFIQIPIPLGYFNVGNTIILLSADAVNGVPLAVSAKKASRFIKSCIQKAVEMDIPITDGVPFEEELPALV